MRPQLALREAGYVGIALGIWALAACGSGGGEGPPDAMPPPVDATPPDEPDAGAVAVSVPNLDAGVANAGFSRMAVDFGTVPCGSKGSTQTLTVRNGGTGTLAITATTTGALFAVSPTTLEVGPDGGTGALTLSAAIPVSATAGIPVPGSLNLFTNDPSNTNVAIPISATPAGATLTFGGGGSPSVSFPLSEVGLPAAPVPFSIANAGNTSATITFGAPSVADFSLGDAGVVTLQAGETYQGNVTFTPTSPVLFSATASISTSDPTCGASVTSIVLSGAGTQGSVTGWPVAPVDFGPADCGGAAPAPRRFVLTNSGKVDAKITAVTWAGAPGFTSNAAVGRTIHAGGGVLSLSVNAPAVAAQSPLTPITATLTIATDADASAHTITLVEEPHGAVLAFDPSATPGFGNFGAVALLRSATQSFSVTNGGNGPAEVTLAIASDPSSDAGASPFAVVTPSFTLGPSGAQADGVTFAPLSANAATAHLALLTSSPLCAQAPAPLPLSGTGLGGGLGVAPGSLTFAAPCGGAAPASQTFNVTNTGNANLTWSMGGVSGAGAANYTVVTTPAPGLLIPGESAQVTVSAAAVPSPPVNADPAAFAGALTITTDVPLDPPHVVPLGVTPLGDQLVFSVPNLRFGQVPTGTSLSQALALENRANPGSPAASFGFALTGTGAAGYSVNPARVDGLAPSATTPPLLIGFGPNAASSYPATLGLVTTDALCAPLPTPLALSGTGTQGKVLVSASTLAFGTDPSDPDGFVDCGGTGLARTFTLSNVGNQAFHLTGIALSRGASSPFAVSAPGTLPLTIPIGGGISLTVTPAAMPSVANPNDATLFRDTLTLTTDAALDTPHAVSLVMQARGAVIRDTPLAATWNFATVGFGAIATLTTAIENDGNAPARVSLSGLAQPSIFGLRTNPTRALGGAATPVVAQFLPPASNGAWADRGTLVVSAEGAFCAPLPAQWSGAAIAMSGSSNAVPPITASGSLLFPPTDCGSPPPAAQALLLSNATDVAYPYTFTLASGAFYEVVSPGPGTVAANGTAQIVLVPKAVAPAAGVTPGSAPYADTLVVSVGTTPTTVITVPIAWTLNGAVLSLPQGAGPSLDSSGVAYYPADSTGSFSLPLRNSGNAPVTVTVGAAPANLLSFSPSSSFQLLAGVTAAPALLAAGTAPACPSTAQATVSFAYAGAVCQPIPFASLLVHACAGAL